MKRKTYATGGECRNDQILGFLAFPVINVAIWFVMDRWLTQAAADHGTYSTQIRIYVLLIPWIVNGLILILLFLFRPEMGRGYIAGLILVVAPIPICSLCMMSCSTSAAEDLFRPPPLDSLSCLLVMGAGLMISLLFILGMAALAGLLRSDK